jgi:hypothetical protein
VNSGSSKLFEYWTRSLRAAEPDCTQLTSGVKTRVAREALEMSRARIPVFFAAFILSVSAVQAGPMWGYRSPSNTVVQTPGEAAGLTFPNTPWLDVTGDTPITVTPVQSWSIATALSPDRVDGEFYSFGLEIKDLASGQTGTLEFDGLLTGSLWKDGTSLTNTFAGVTTQAMDLGLHRYTVELDAFEPPAGFGEAKAGRITADVVITPLGDASPPAPDDGESSPTAVQTPEPTTLVLGVIAIGLGATSMRSRRPDRLAGGATGDCPGQ